MQKEEKKLNLPSSWEYHHLAVYIIESRYTCILIYAVPLKRRQNDILMYQRQSRDSADKSLVKGEA